MKLNTFFIFAALVLAATLSVPGDVSAYFTTEQSSYKLSTGKALFTITYSFGFSERDVYLPLTAERNNTVRPNMSYDLIQNGTSTDVGEAVGVVLSKAQIKNNQYFIPAGQKADFTFVSLVDMSTSKIKSVPTSILVSSLPFTMVSHGQETPAQLNPSELQYYRTPEIMLP